MALKDLAAVVVSQAGLCEKLVSQEQRQTACLSAGDSDARHICELLYTMGTSCAVEKFWQPLGNVVNCLKQLHPSQPPNISTLYPLLDHIGDLPFNDEVQSAVKAFMNQMLAHMFSPDTDLTVEWAQQAFCEARLALTYQYEYQQRQGALSALACAAPAAPRPLRLYAKRGMAGPRLFLQATGWPILLASSILLTAVVMLTLARRPREAELGSELEGLSEPIERQGLCD
ncbi:unnamed protein product [Effrenium voratum]|nr:unnamed protein product [Effrenium voratum]